MDNDKAQVSACPRCGTPSSPRGHGYTAAGYTCPPGDVVAALREELAHAQDEARTALLALGGQLAAAERERGALRGALLGVATATEAAAASLYDGSDETVHREIEQRLGEAWEHALDVLGRVTP